MDTRGAGESKRAALLDGPSRNQEAGIRLEMLHLGGVIPPRAALEAHLPSCPDAILQYLSRHWITSFRLVAVEVSLPQILRLSKLFTLPVASIFA